MAKFMIEIYEVHSILCSVDADNVSDALRKYNTEGGRFVDSSGEMIETDNTRGMSREKAIELGIVEDLIDEDWGIASIRSINKGI